MPQATLRAFLEHGRATETITQDGQGARLTIKSLEEAGVSMNQVPGKLGPSTTLARQALLITNHLLAIYAQKSRGCG